MRHVNERHKITDDVHQSMGLSWKPFDKKSDRENAFFGTYSIFFNIYFRKNRGSNKYDFQRTEYRLQLFNQVKDISKWTSAVIYYFLVYRHKFCI